MSTQDPQARISQLRADHNRLTTAVTLQHKLSDLKNLETSLNTLTQTAQKLVQAGYPRGASLVEQVKGLTQHFAQVEAAFSQILGAASSRLQAELGQANLGVGGALAGQVAFLDSSIQALQALEERVESADQQLDSLLKPLQDARYEAENLFRNVSWSVEAWGDFSGDKNSGGGLLIAAEAEWKQTGRGGDDPDGVLYLTDKALIFEQKEKKGKTLGMFGGKMVQEVEWAIPLATITDVRTKNEGMFGGRDILFISVSTGDPAPEVKVEVKGSADNKAWAAYVQKATQGEDLFAVPPLSVATVDVSIWSGALPSAPAKDIGAAMAGVVAQHQATQAKEAAADVARAMFGIPQQQDEDESPKGGAKGSEKSAGAKGGEKTAETGGESKQWSKGGEETSDEGKGKSWAKDSDDDKPTGISGMMKGLAQNMSKDDDDDTPKGGQKAD